VSEKGVFIRGGGWGAVNVFNISEGIFERETGGGRFLRERQKASTGGHIL